MLLHFAILFQEETHIYDQIISHKSGILGLTKKLLIRHYLLQYIFVQMN